MQNMFFCPLILVISGKNGLMPTFLCNALVGGWSLLQVMARLKGGAAAIWVFLIIPCAELLHTPEVFTAGFLPVSNIWARVDDTQRSLKNAGMIPSTGRLDVCWSKWLGSAKRKLLLFKPIPIAWPEAQTTPTFAPPALPISNQPCFFHTTGWLQMAFTEQQKISNLEASLCTIVQTNPPYPNTEEGKTGFLES